MNFKNIMFDFDGTLCDSFEVFKSAFTIVAEEYSLNTKCLERKNLRDFQTKEILKELGVSMIQLPFVVKRGREEMLKMKYDLKLFPGVKDFLEKLIANNFSLSILTSNSQELVAELIPSEILKDVYLAKPSPLFGKAKSIKSYLKANSISSKELIYIGDETRDIVSAKEAFVSTAAVTYGYNSKSALVETNPDYIFNSVEEMAASFLRK